MASDHGSISVNTIVSPREETFYWITITFSQTLGTALGDWIADSSLGYGGGALFFGALLAVIAAFYFWTRLSHVMLFWAAFILTRPLGATLGDLFDKPIDKGGFRPQPAGRLAGTGGRDRRADLADPATAGRASGAEVSGQG